MREPAVVLRLKLRCSLSWPLFEYYPLYYRVNVLGDIQRETDGV